MRISFLFEAISYTDVLDFYGMVGSGIDWDEYRDDLLSFSVELFEGLKFQIKDRILVDLRPRAEIPKDQDGNVYRPVTAEELYEVGLGPIELCERVSRAEQEPDAIEDGDVDAVLDWYRSHETSYYTITRCDGLWVKAWNLINKIEPDIYGRDISLAVIATDQLIQLMHHDGTMLTYIGGVSDKGWNASRPNGTNEKWKEILDLKFNSRNIDEFWHYMSHPVRVRINKARYRSGLGQFVSKGVSDHTREVIRDRLRSEAMKNPWLAYKYALDVIKGRWPEGEPIIMQSPWIACCYIKDVIKGRWPEAEPVIMKDPWMAYNYARHAIKGRWLEAEPTIMKDAKIRDEYNKAFGIRL